MLVNLISWTIFGLFVGALARFVVPGRDPMGCLMTVVLGVVGSWLGGMVGYLIWGSAARGVEPAGFLGAVLGSVLLLLAYRQLGASRMP